MALTIFDQTQRDFRFNPLDPRRDLVRYDYADDWPTGGHTLQGLFLALSGITTIEFGHLQQELLLDELDRELLWGRDSATVTLLGLQEETTDD